MKRNNNVKKTFTRTSNDFVYNSFSTKNNDKNKTAISETKTENEQKIEETPKICRLIDKNIEQTNNKEIESVIETEDQKKPYADLYRMYDKIEALMLKFLFEEEDGIKTLSKRNCHNIFTTKTNYDSVLIYDATTNVPDIDNIEKEKNTVKPYRYSVDLDDDITYIKNQNTTVERLKQTEMILYFARVVDKTIGKQKTTTKFKKDYRLSSERNGFRVNSVIYELLEMSEPCIESESDNQYKYKVVASKCSNCLDKNSNKQNLMEDRITRVNVMEIKDVDCNNKTRDESAKDTR